MGSSGSHSNHSFSRHKIDVDELNEVDLITIGYDRGLLSLKRAQKFLTQLGISSWELPHILEEHKHAK
jgi:hypothetical protein